MRLFFTADQSVSSGVSSRGIRTVSLESSCQARCWTSAVSDSATPRSCSGTLNELLELIEPASNTSIEPARRADEIEEAGRVHLGRREDGQLRKLLGVWLWSRNDEAQSVFRSVCWRVDHSPDELSDKIPHRFVAQYKLR